MGDVKTNTGGFCHRGFGPMEDLVLGDYIRWDFILGDLVRERCNTIGQFCFL